MKGKVKAWCRTCMYLLEKRADNKVICGHKIMHACVGDFPIWEKQNCILWHKRPKKRRKEDSE